MSSSSSCHRNDSIQNDCKELPYEPETRPRLTLKKAHELHAIDDDESRFLNSHRVDKPIISLSGQGSPAKKNLRGRGSFQVSTRQRRLLRNRAQRNLPRAKKHLYSNRRCER